MNRKEAEALVGPLSKPSKMPGRAWGTPAAFCKRGSILRKQEGTVCSLCYASKGRYLFENARKAYLRRWELYWSRPSNVWVQAMVDLIGSHCKKVPYFRWFDSGDLQNEDMLAKICQVCEQLPDVHFWMSTRERQILADYQRNRVLPPCPTATPCVGIPPNLVIRVSADLIGRKAADYPNTSTVEKIKSVEDWQAKVKYHSTGDSFYCRAPLQEGKCGECRECWDRNVRNVVYKAH